MKPTDTFHGIPARIPSIDDRLDGLEYELNKLKLNLNELNEAHKKIDGSREGMNYCIKLINELRQKYSAMNVLYNNYMTANQVLNDIENEIGIRLLKDWKIK